MPAYQKLQERIGVNLGMDFYIFSRQRFIWPFSLYNFQYNYRKGNENMFYVNDPITKNFYFENTIGIGVGMGRTFFVAPTYSVGIITQRKLSNGIKTQSNLFNNIFSLRVGYNFN